MLSKPRRRHCIAYLQSNEMNNESWHTFHQRMRKMTDNDPTSHKLNSGVFFLSMWILIQNIILHFPLIYLCILAAVGKTQLTSEPIHFPFHDPIPLIITTCLYVRLNSDPFTYFPWLKLWKCEEKIFVYRGKGSDEDGEWLQSFPSFIPVYQLAKSERRMSWNNQRLKYRSSPAQSFTSFSWSHIYHNTNREVHPKQIKTDERRWDELRMTNDGEKYFSVG